MTTIQWNADDLIAEAAVVDSVSHTLTDLQAPLTALSSLHVPGERYARVVSDIGQLNRDLGGLDAALSKDVSSLRASVSSYTQLEASIKEGLVALLGGDLKGITAPTWLKGVHPVKGPNSPAPAIPKPGASLEEGSSGPQVQQAQELLAKDGYPPHATDGHFDASTVAEVKRFQGDHGLAVTGIVDATTMRALINPPKKKIVHPPSPSGGGSGGGGDGGTRGAKAVSIAKQYLGRPYVYGGNGPATFDCSGLTSYVYRQEGVSIPRTAEEQRKFCTHVSAKDAQPGDLVFFGVPATHVAIYEGNGRIIAAPKPGDVVKEEPVFYNDGPVSYGRP